VKSGFGLDELRRRSDDESRVSKVSKFKVVLIAVRAGIWNVGNHEKHLKTFRSLCHMHSMTYLPWPLGKVPTKRSELVATKEPTSP